MVVWTEAGDGPWHGLAADLADRRGEELVGEAPGERAGEPIYYVCPPRELTASTALGLQRRLQRLGPEAGAYGVVTGITPEDASELVRPSDDGGPERHAVALVRDAVPDGVETADTSHLTTNEASVDEIEALSPMASLSLMLSGRSIHMRFADGWLCGYPSVRDISDVAVPDLPCVGDGGERECPFEEPILPVDRLEAEHVFMDACSSLIPDETGGNAVFPVHIGLNLLANARAVIGGYRIMDGRPNEAALHDALLQSGYSAVERCYLLNASKRRMGLAEYPYLLFGRPEARFDGSHDSGYRYTVDGSTLRLHDLDARVVDVTIPDPAPGGGGRRFVTNESDVLTDVPLYYLAIPQPKSDALRVVVYSWGRLEGERLELEVRDGPKREAVHRRLTRTIGNGTALDRFGLLDKKATGQLRNLRNQAASLTDAVAAERREANHHREEATVASVVDALDAFEDRLVSILAGRDVSFFCQDYEGNVVGADVGVDDDPCPYCGGPVFQRSYEDYVREHGRLRGMCHQCGNVYDVPVPAGAEDAATVPTVAGDLDATARDDSLDVTLEMENPHGTPARLVFYPWFHADADDLRGSDRFAPERVTRRLSPGETGAVEFEVDVGGLEPDSYVVYGYVLVDCDVYLATRVLAVR